MCSLPVLMVCGETGYYGNRGGVGQRQAAAEEFILDKQSGDSPLACRTTEPEPLEPDQNLLRWCQKVSCSDPSHQNCAFTRVVPDDPLQLPDLLGCRLGDQAVEQGIVGNQEAERGQLRVGAG